MAKVTAEDNLLMAGFQTTIDSDSNGYDSSWDDSDVLRALQANPDLTVGQISPKINIPVHRVVAAIARLKTAGKFPVNPPAGIVVNFPDCSKGNIETGEPVATEEPLTVITLWQPWATFIAKGIKLFETRGWIPDHKGKILIHASASHKLNWLELDIESLEEIYPDVKNWDYPLGAIVAEAELINCHRVEAVRDKLGEAERLCGNYSNGRYAWELTNVKPIFIPNVKGKQNLWKYDGGNVKPSEEVISLRPKESESLICSKGNIGSCVNDKTEPGTLVIILNSEGLWKIDSFKDGHAKVDLIEGDRKLPKRRRVALHQLRIARSVEPLTISDVVLGETVETVEPVTNILLEEPPRQVEANGQLSLFFDDSEEPPDPDDYPNNYEEVYEQWALKFPELNAAINRKKSQEIKNSHCEIGDYIQLKLDPRRIGQITGLKSGGLYKIRFADGFATDLKADQFEDRPFSKENSEIVLGESFFKIGEYVTASSPGFEGKVFTVSTIYPTGMIGVIHNGNNLSFPANWLNHHIEKIESKAKSIPLEQTEVTTRKRPAKGCGSGYLMVRSANVKRNEAKGKSPDIYYCFCYSYTNQYGKEIKSSISVPRAKIAQVKSMVENKEHYVKIAKFLGKNLPLSY